MRRIPTPSEIQGVNATLQRETAERRSRENAEGALEEIAEKLEREGIPSGGLRYRVRDSLATDFRAIDSISNRLRAAGWDVTENPDDDDDVGHHRHAVSVLLIRFPRNQSR